MYKGIRKKTLRYLKERGIYKPYLACSTSNGYNRPKFSKLWKNEEKDALNGHYSHFIDIITVSFPWSLTKEGSSFWANESFVFKNFISCGGFVNGFRVELMDYVNRQTPLLQCHE